MKDRQFITVLALVVAAGLVMGLVAFRMTAGDPVSRAATSATSNNGAPRPSSADDASAQWSDSAPQPSETEPRASEQKPPPYNPPEMQGAGTGDAPGPPAEVPSDASQ